MVDTNLKHLYFNEGDSNFVQVLEAPNPDGTTVQYRVTVWCTEFIKHKEKILSILSTVFNETIHPVVTKIYDLTKKQDVITFHPSIHITNGADDWSIFPIDLQINDNNVISLQVTPNHAYIYYHTSNEINEPSMVSFDQRYIDGSSIRIKVDTKHPVDYKYKVGYRYVKRIAKSTSAILEGIDDIFALHYKHMLL